jgi:hypothetical protein
MKLSDVTNRSEVLISFVHYGYCPVIAYIEKCDQGVVVYHGGKNDFHGYGADKNITCWLYADLYSAIKDYYIAFDYNVNFIASDLARSIIDELQELKQRYKKG